jgi:hypothetical protein
MPSTGPNDWLDGLALRSVTRRASRVSAPPALEPGEERLSRAAAVRLGAFGVASLALGAWRAPEARAQGAEGCFTECVRKHDQALKKDVDACDRVFFPRAWDETAPGTWKRFRRSFRLGVTSAVVDMTAASLLGLCVGKAQLERRRELDDCERSCESTCRARSLQGVSEVRAEACRGTEPKRNETPKFPPAPHASSEDPCWACAQVPNCVCCGPFVDGVPCGTIDSSIGCDAIGC